DAKNMARDVNNALIQIAQACGGMDENSAIAEFVVFGYRVTQTGHAEFPELRELGEFLELGEKRE
ncbi:17509_t:CDS:2, partial [Dentiscutata erythropus]